MSPRVTSEVYSAAIITEVQLQLLRKIDETVLGDWKVAARDVQRAVKKGKAY
jgi:hypothetical protein